MSMRLLLVRHGATAFNLEQRITGQSDAPLSPVGQRQAEALAAALAGTRLDLIVSSDLLRARQTAEAITQRNDAPLRLDPDLREVNMGAWEGRVYAEIAAEFPAELARWEAKRGPYDFAPPGGESVAQLRDRAVRALARYQRDIAGSGGQQEPGEPADRPPPAVLWVTHGGLIGVLLCHLLGIDLAHRWQFRRDNTGLSELDLGPEGPMLLRLNETCHLRGLPDDGPTERTQVL